MATRLEVTCINKGNRTDPYERISNIGGIRADGTRWRLAVEQAIAQIKSGQTEFYVRKSGHEVKVIIATRNGREYLKTENDRDTPDNLLSLPEC